MITKKTIDQEESTMSAYEFVETVIGNEMHLYDEVEKIKRKLRLKNVYLLLGITLFYLYNRGKKQMDSSTSEEDEGITIITTPTGRLITGTSTK